MATLSPGLAQVGYNGSTVTLSGASWKDNVNAIFKVSDDGSGWSAFEPSSLFNSLEELQDGKHYLFDVKTSFTLAGLEVSHPAAGAGVPDGLLIMDGEQVLMQ